MIWPEEHDTATSVSGLEEFSARGGFGAHIVGEGRFFSPCIHVHLHSTAAWHGVFLGYHGRWGLGS